MTAPELVTAEPPDARQVARACEVRVVHRRVADPFVSTCRACRESWPCPDQRWAIRVLIAMSEERHGRA